MTLVLRAAEFAADKHRKQRRKGKTKRPYIGHCIEVARILAETGKVDDADILAAAILHDTVEDTETTREELRQKFGPRIDDFVGQLTDDKTLDKNERKKVQVDRAPHLSPSAKLIAIADKISNVRYVANDPPRGWGRKRREKYFEWAERVVDAMGDVNAELDRAFRTALSEATDKLAREQSEA
jgi:GTP diphosphokinase / guanosine-3',5'-bis(diphosphate) 3'-diphosphatase